MSYPPRDPVDVLCAERYDIWGHDERVEVRAELLKVRRAGWRIVPARNLDEGEILGEWEP